MDRLFDRAFNKAHGAAHSVVGAAAAAAASKERQQLKQQSREDVLRALTTPMTSEDVVERIGMAYKDNDYFRLVLQLNDAQMCDPALHNV